MATNGRRVALALAPAGAGKTTAMAALSHAWRNSGGTVLGLAPTAAASINLGADLTAPTDTLDKYIHLIDNPSAIGDPEVVLRRRFLHAAHRRRGRKSRNPAIGRGHQPCVGQGRHRAPGR